MPGPVHPLPHCQLWANNGALSAPESNNRNVKNIRIRGFSKWCGNDDEIKVIKLLSTGYLPVTTHALLHFLIRSDKTIKILVFKRHHKLIKGWCLLVFI